MRITLLLFIGLYLMISAGSCRKPGHTYRSPCNDSTLLSLYERRASLSPAERSTFDSLYEECAKYEAAEENRGKLWPWLLGGVAAVIGVILLLVFFNTEPPIYD